MKKFIMTTALAIATFGIANADGLGGGAGANNVHDDGALQVTVNDFLSMDPGLGFGVGGPVTFSTPGDQVAGTPLAGHTVSIVASRAWRFDYSAGPFLGIGGNGGVNVAQSVPAGAIFTVTTNAGSGDVVTFGTVPAASGAGNLMAYQTHGTTGSTFFLSGNITPGLNNQMSGTYQSAITQIASLD